MLTSGHHGSFSGRRKKSNRFSLLLFEDGEFYVSECVVECARFPSRLCDTAMMASVPQRLGGELRVCTKSLFFQPSDMGMPIVRLPFKHIQVLHGRVLTVEVSTLSYTTMKRGGRDEPYGIDKGETSDWSFVLQYTTLEDVLPYMQQMLALSRMGVKESREMYDVFLEELERRHRFDVGCLESPSDERVLLEVSAMLVSQLTKERGRFVMTESRIYFQPIHNVSGSERVRSHPLSKIVAVVRQRSSLQDIGMELYFDTLSKRRKAGTWGSSTACIVFKTRDDREDVVGRLWERMSGTNHVTSRVLEGQEEYLSKVTYAWQRGGLTNFEYLMYCNIASGRSCTDLTRYPIFPWILQDFTSKEIDLGNPNSYRDLSKPVGALNPKRLKMFHSRYREMVSMKDETGEEPFLYGTHYSCPGYTLFWLVRSMPAHMLRLQKGKFDAPDRSFTGMEDAWNSVYNSPTDLKELIPEFYSLESSEFLKNGRNLALGCRQNGQPVGDVELPPWAHGDAELFLKIHKDALESPYVSANLHHWIDLVFGAYQCGARALEHNNLFRHITYEGMVDIDAIQDPLEKESIEVSIAEFGQCPRQIFMSEHPRRLVCESCSDTACLTSGTLDSAMLRKLQQAIELLDDPMLGDARADDAIILDTLDTVGKSDAESLSHSVKEDRDASQCVEENNNTSQPTSPSRWNSFSMLNLKTSVESLKDSVVSGSRRAGSMLKNSDIMSQQRVFLAEKMQAHWQALSPRKRHSEARHCSPSILSDFDSSITHISPRPGKEKDIALSFENGCVLTFDASNGQLTGRETLSQLPISSIGWIQEHTIASGHDGILYKWDPDGGGFESCKAHSDIISCIECMGGNRIVSASWDHSMKLFDISKIFLTWSNDTVAPLQEFQSPCGAIWSMATVSENAILAGSEEGSVMLFDTRMRDSCAQYKICNDYIGDVCTCSNNHMYGIAAADGMLRVLDPRKAGQVITSQDIG